MTHCSIVTACENPPSPESFPQTRRSFLVEDKMTQTALSINTGTLKEWLSSGFPSQLIDVRSASEFATAHVPGAINIPLEQIELRTADLRSDVPVVLICQAGTRARMAADLLAGSAKNFMVLDGGTDAWLRAGEPAVRSTAALLAVTISPWWLIVPAFVGCGLTFAGLTGLCLMGEFLARLPWNRTRRSPDTVSSLQPGVSCASELPKQT
jgi:rhodanese-related sulfurtransferase